MLADRQDRRVCQPSSGGEGKRYGVEREAPKQAMSATPTYSRHGPDPASQLCMGWACSRPHLSATRAAHRRCHEQQWR